MRFLIMITVLLSISACSFVTEEVDDNYGAGYINISESEWVTKYNTPYPFTVPHGEISCTYHPNFGREVYFNSKGFTDESYIGTPLNKSAVYSLRQSDMVSNVPYSIKQDVSLNQAIKLGLKVCDEQKQMLEANKTS